MEYIEFIKNINDGLIKSVCLELSSYSHYKNIEIIIEKAINPKLNNSEQFINKITLNLTKDKKESSVMFGTFKENEKFFKIKGKGTFTFKELWKDIVVKEIVYK